MSHYFDKQELSRLLAVAKQQNPQYALAMTVAYTFALRVSELVKIKASDIADGKLHVKRLKGSKPTLQPIPESCAGIIELAGTLKPNERLFKFSRQRFDDRIKKYGALAGIHKVKLHAHSLRHSTAHHSIEAGVSINSVQRHMGHASLASTGHYLVVSDEAASQAVNKALAS